MWRSQMQLFLAVALAHAHSPQLQAPQLQVVALCAFRHQLPINGAAPTRNTLLQAPAGMTVDSWGVIHWLSPLAAANDTVVEVRIEDAEGGVVIHTFRVLVQAAPRRRLFLKGQWGINAWYVAGMVLVGFLAMHIVLCFGYNSWDAWNKKRLLEIKRRESDAKLVFANVMKHKGSLKEGDWQPSSITGHEAMFEEDEEKKEPLFGDKQEAQGTIICEAPEPASPIKLSPLQTQVPTLSKLNNSGSPSRNKTSITSAPAEEAIGPIGRPKLERKSSVTMMDEGAAPKLERRYSSINPRESRGKKQLLSGL